MCAITGFDAGHYHPRIKECGVNGQGEEMSADQLCRVASTLHEFTTTMVENVDSYQTRVQAVNEELQEAACPSSEVVFAAVTQLIQSNASVQNQLQSARDRIEQQTMQMNSGERRDEIDALTQVLNRRAFDAHLKQRHAAGAGAAGTLALLNVDLFRRFNDVYGQGVGDEVLRVVADVLQSHLLPAGLVARFGGEEFAIIFDGGSTIEATLKIEQARAAIGQLVIEMEGQSLKVAASAGVATLMENETVESWLQRTDDALYHSKSQGGNCAHRMLGKKPTLIELSSERFSVPKLQRSSPIDSGSDRGEGDTAVLRSVKRNEVFASLEIDPH
ncbi:MAG: GGDEF domain-containing protein [Rubripirellula sp.]|nr:GGDEF domain-containing protein [Rubripirellula sp.]